MKTKNIALRDVFLRASHIRYVVFRNYHTLPISHSLPHPVILTDNLHSLSDLWNLQKGFIPCEFAIEYGQGQRCLVQILEKGKNVFPESFESSILSRAVLNEGVKMPADEHRALLLLYWELTYGRMWGEQPENRDVLLRYIHTHVGPTIRPRYRWLAANYCITPRVPAQP